MRSKKRIKRRSMEGMWCKQMIKNCNCVFIHFIEFCAHFPVHRWTLPSILIFFANFSRYSHRNVSVISGWKSIFRKWHKFNTWRDKKKCWKKNAPTTILRPHIRMRLHTKSMCFLFPFHVAWGVNKYIERAPF